VDSSSEEACLGHSWRALENSHGLSAFRGLQLKKVAFEKASQAERFHDQSHLSPVKKRDPVASIRLVEIGGGNQNGHPLPVEFIEDLPEIPSGHGIYAVGRLVQEQDLGVGMSTAQAHSFHASGKLSEKTIGKGKTENSNRFILCHSGPGNLVKVRIEPMFS
jgi:hypothetical protein